MSKPSIAAIMGAVAFLVLTVLVVMGVTQSFDDAALRWLAAHRTPVLDSFMLHITMLGHGMVTITLAIVVAVFLWIVQRRRTAVILLVAVIAGKLLSPLLKGLVDRDRPDIVPWLERVTSESYPSGHAMGAMVAFGAIAWAMDGLRPGPRLRTVIAVFACSIILLVGVSRSYLGVHYPSDVVGGFAAGLAWLGLCMSQERGVSLRDRAHGNRTSLPEPPN